jgi:CheY-like chemotaxis protein
MGYAYSLQQIELKEFIERHKKIKKDHQLSHEPVALIADDDHLAAQLLQIALMNFGIKATLAYDGKEALRLISKKPFDLIFLDIYMPGLTGTEVLARLEEIRHQHGEHRPDLHIITYSSYEQNEIRVPREQGFHVVGHWKKPMTMPELATQIGKTILQLHIPVPRSTD